jgi:hypothetical protein
MKKSIATLLVLGVLTATSSNRELVQSVTIINNTVVITPVPDRGGETVITLQNDETPLRLGINPVGHLSLRMSHLEGRREMVLGFESEAGVRYVIEYADSLQSGVWLPLKEVDGDGQRIEIREPADKPQRFYRIISRKP